MKRNGWLILQKSYISPVAAQEDRVAHPITNGPPRLFLVRFFSYFVFYLLLIYVLFFLFFSFLLFLLTFRVLKIFVKKFIFKKCSLLINVQL